MLASQKPCPSVGRQVRAFMRVWECRFDGPSHAAHQRQPVVGQSFKRDKLAAGQEPGWCVDMTLFVAQQHSDCQSCLTHCAHVLSCCEQTYLAAYNGILFLTW